MLSASLNKTFLSVSLHVIRTCYPAIPLTVSRRNSWVIVTGPAIPTNDFQSLFVMKAGNVLFNDTLNTFYLRWYGVRHMVKDHSDSERGSRFLFSVIIHHMSNEGNVLFNDALNTFYLRLYGVGMSNDIDQWRRATVVTVCWNFLIIILFIYYYYFF